MYYREAKESTRMGRELHTWTGKYRQVTTTVVRYIHGRGNTGKSPPLSLDVAAWDMHGPVYGCGTV